MLAASLAPMTKRTPGRQCSCACPTLAIFQFSPARPPVDCYGRPTWSPYSSGELLEQADFFFFFAVSVALMQIRSGELAHRDQARGSITIRHWRPAGRPLVGLEPKLSRSVWKANELVARSAASDKIQIRLMSSETVVC